MRPGLAPRDERDRLIVALDVGSTDEARRLVETLRDTVRFYKIGMQLVFAGGLTLADELARSGKRVFLDMKLLDIDNTVTNAVANIAAIGVSFTTIHAYPTAMRAAVAGRGEGGPGLLAVTVLTSLDDADLASAGYAAGVSDLVCRRATDARDCGMDGIVCSPAEVEMVRAAVGAGMALVTPGVRPAGATAGDQKRLATPGDAIRSGADYLVVGRPITRAREPAAAASAIVEEIQDAL
jgi:orotidine-5'-phosphate decarboxylase